MSKQILPSILLILLAVGFLAGGILLLRQSAVCETAMAELSQLETQASQLQQELNGLTTANAEDMAAQADYLQEDTARMRQQLDPLREEIGTLTAQLDENSGAIATLNEDLAYLQDVYTALEEGLAYVNRLIAES